MGFKGIDVSQHQGVINWDKVKASGVSFAILRLGWIGNKNNHTLDTQFERNYKEAKRVGIPVGVYVYCYSASEETAKSGANWAVEKLKGKTLDLPVYIDMEDKSIASKGKTVLTNICIAFNTIIEKAGYWAGVYANLNWYNNYLNKEEIKKRYTTWIAHYGINENKYNGQYDILQYTSSGKVNGIDSNSDGRNDNVDMNMMYRDLLSDIKGSKVTTSTTVSKPKKSVDEVAKEIVKGVGNWGNGQERVNKLTNAGYNTSEVQAKVNSLMGVSKPNTTKAVYHTVKKGDTLWDLAVKYYGQGNKYTEIKKLNGLTSDRIFANQKLRIK